MNVKRKPKRTAGQRYDADSYRRAIHRACDKAGIESIMELKVNAKPLVDLSAEILALCVVEDTLRMEKADCSIC